MSLTPTTRDDHGVFTGACVGTALLLVAAACRPDLPPVDPSHAAEVEAWRAQRLERLTAADGWLTLTGLYWLEPGANSFGSDPGNRIVIPDETVPPVAGSLVLTEEGIVTASVASAAAVTLNGQPLAAEDLASDAAGSPDVLQVGRVTFYVIERGDRLAVRVKDPMAATRTGFTGIDHFPINPNFRVVASFEPYTEAHEVAIPTAIGTDETVLAPGVLRFSIQGHEVTLEPFAAGGEDESLFLVFSDATSGTETYGGGRFLSADRPRDGVVTLDFNRAYNPPCAFTPYATCPLPPPHNRLPVRVEAGERYSGSAH